MPSERIKRLRASVEMLTHCAIIQPDHWSEPLDLARTRLRRALDAETVGDFHRDVFAARTRHQLASETHVIVGDDPPELRRAS